MRVRGGERLTAEDQARGPVPAQGSHQGPGRAGVGHQPDPHEGLDEARVVGGVDEVTGERQGGAGTRGDAVDRGDHRLGQVPDGADERVVLVGQDAAEVALAAAAAQVRPAAEAASLTGDDDGADRLVASRRLDRGEQLGAHRCVEGIQRLGPVEGDGRDGVGQIDPDRLVRRLAHRAILPAGAGPTVSRLRCRPDGADGRGAPSCGCHRSPWCTTRRSDCATSRRRPSGRCRCDTP